MAAVALRALNTLPKGPLRARSGAHLRRGELLTAPKAHVLSVHGHPVAPTPATNTATTTPQLVESSKLTTGARSTNQVIADDWSLWSSDGEWEDAHTTDDDEDGGGKERGEECDDDYDDEEDFE